MSEWIAQLSNGWALSVVMYAPNERGYVEACHNNFCRDKFHFMWHPRKRTRWTPIERFFTVPALREDFDSNYRSMNEAIKMAYDYVLEQLEAEKIVAEKEQVAKEVLEEAKVTGKMFQQADAALQRCLAGGSK